MTILLQLPMGSQVDKVRPPLPLQVQDCAAKPVEPLGLVLPLPNLLVANKAQHIVQDLQNIEQTLISHSEKHITISHHNQII